MIHNLVHPSGEFAARFMIVALMVTPLAMLVQTILHLIEKAGLDPVFSDLPEFAIWTGWVAFLIFIPLAVTSNDWFVRRMGTWWK